MTKKQTGAESKPQITKNEVAVVQAIVYVDRTSAGMWRERAEKEIESERYG